MSGSSLEGALSTAKSVFAGDLGIAQSLASEHNHKVKSGSLFEPVVSGGLYQPRTPVGGSDEVERLSNSESLTIFCFDRRQVYQAATELGVNDKAHAKLAVASGAAQTNVTRESAVANLATAYYDVNPNGRINLIAHTGRCGGVVKWMGISFYDMITNERVGGWDGSWENDAMKSLVNGMQYELLKRGVPATAIFQYLTHLNGEQYFGLTQID